MDVEHLDDCEYQGRRALAFDPELDEVWEEFGDEGPTGIAAFKSGRYV
jgi:hypothetical protein